MRKLKLQMNITMDGFVGDTNGKLDWMLPEVDQKQIDFMNKLTKTVDTIVLGRKMATESIPHWEKIAKTNKKDQETEYAKFFTRTSKIVFSKSLKSIEGENVHIEATDLKESMRQLKQKPGNDLIVYGGATFVSSLLHENLIDELNLCVHPVALGKGLPIFQEHSKFKLIKSDSYENGIVLNTYQPL